MSHGTNLTCPVCKGNDFTIKYEAAYVYSYVIDSNAPGLKNSKEFLPFMFDNREQKDIKQYIACSTCHTEYPCYFDQWDQGVNLKALQDAISTAYAEKTGQPVS